MNIVVYIIYNNYICTMEEIWIEINGFDGYFVSNLGRVRGTRQNKDIILKNRTIGKSNNNKHYAPYQQVVLYENGKQKAKMIHRLVGEHFIPNPENKPQVHHKDIDVTNNNMTNLEWVTASENVKHTLSYRKKYVGVDNNLTKLTNDKVLKIREMYSEGGITQKELAKMFGVTQPNIKEILKRRTWKHI